MEGPPRFLEKASDLDEPTLEVEPILDLDKEAPSVTELDPVTVIPLLLKLPALEPPPETTLPAPPMLDTFPALWALDLVVVARPRAKEENNTNFMFGISKQRGYL